MTSDRPETDPPESYAFGHFRFHVADRTLTRDGVLIRLTPKTAELLLALLAADGRLVTKEELLQRIWPSTFVEDSNLPFQVHQVRQALDDSAAEPRYIETLPRRGYRFIHPIETERAELARATPVEIDVERQVPPSVALEPTAVIAGETNPPGGVRPRGWSRWSAVAVVLVVATAAAVFATNLAEPPPLRIARITALTSDGTQKGLLVVLDRDRLLAWTGRSQSEFRISDGTWRSNHALAEYQVFDVSPTRGEALAIRPADAGAEHGLWAVRLDGSGARRIGMVQTRGRASWSHDGQKIVYTDQHNVYVTDASGGPVKTIGTFSGNPDDPRWSRTDRLVRVAVGNSSNRTVTTNIFDIRADGSGAPTPAFHSPLPWLNSGVWIPDSSEYVFEAGTEQLTDIWAVNERWVPFSQRERVSYRLTNGEPAGARYSNPVPSLDGKRIFVLATSRPRLSVYDASRHAMTSYLGGIPAYAVRFSPDHRSVVYIDFFTSTLWRANADGSNPRQLTFQPWSVDAVEWSPDGRRLALRARAPGQDVTKVHIMSASGGQPEPIDPRRIEQGTPTWSPDGGRVAFGDVPDQYGNRSGTERIHVHDLLAHTTVDVPGSLGLWSSRWSPDGTYLAATRISDRAVMLFSFATKQWRELPLTRVDHLTWSADGQYLYCEAESGTRPLARIRFPKGEVESLIDLSSYSIRHTGAGLALDGRPLLLVSPTNIYALELDRR